MKKYNSIEDFDKPSVPIVMEIWAIVKIEVYRNSIQSLKQTKSMYFRSLNQLIINNQPYFSNKLLFTRIPWPVFCEPVCEPESDPACFEPSLKPAS